jgi:hypothetical protein
MRSRDGGRTFEAAREISKPHPKPAESAGFPALSVDEQGRMFVLWELFPDPRGYAHGLAITYSLDLGHTFSTPAAVPGSDPAEVNGGLQGMLMRKLAVNGGGAIALVNSSLKPGEKSRVWLMRGQRK